jgi:signal transduction histidine kinase
LTTQAAIPTPDAPPMELTDQRLDELFRIIESYNQVSQKLQQTHETLTSEVCRLQTELASANVELQRTKRLAAMGEMAAGIAHEVRNPLASIQLYATILQKDLADRPQQQDVARKIGAAVRGLDAVVGDVLSFARELKLKRDEVPAAAIFDRAVESLRPMIETARVVVKIQLEDDEIAVSCDRDAIHQAMTNLVRNAVEAMERGGTLTLIAERDSGGVRICVKDTGPGISDESIDRIFNPFFTTRATGTGLGLAIVHRIVDAHGGAIAVHNDSARGGAVFTLTLPSHEPHALQSLGDRS